MTLSLPAATVAASVCPPDIAGFSLTTQASADDQRPCRLLKRSEFLAVREGAKRRGPLFLLEVLDRADENPPRFGLTVTKKAGNAVARNRIRRRLREAVRRQAAGMSAGKDYVIVGRSDLLTARFSDIEAELLRRLRGGRSASSRS